MKTQKPKQVEKIKLTPGKGHSWVKARVGQKEIVIRKQNKNINLETMTVISPETRDKINKHLRGSWWKRLLKWLKIIK